MIAASTYCVPGTVAGLFVIQVLLFLVGLPLGADQFAVLIASRGLKEVDVARTLLHRIIHGVVGVAHLGRKTRGDEREILIDRQVGAKRIAGGLLPTALREHVIGVVQAVAAGQFAVLEADGESVRRRVDDVAVDGRRSLDGLHVLGHVALHAQIHHRGLGDVHVDVRAEVIAFVVDILAVTADLVAHPRIFAGFDGILPLLVVEGEGREVAGELAAARDIGAHLLRKRHLFHKELLPVDIGIDLGVGLHAHGLDLVGAVFQCRRGIHGIHRLVEHFGAGSGVDERQAFAGERETLLVTQVDPGRAVETAARVDKDNAVGTAYAVYGRGAGVFQDAERLDLQRVDVVERTLDTVDQDQRIGTARKGGDTADPELGVVLAGLARGLQCDDARQVAGQRLAQRPHGDAQFLGPDRGDGPHDRFAFLGTVAHGDNFDALHADGLGLERDRHRPCALGRDLLRLVTDIRHDERDVAVGILQIEGTVDIGRRSDRGAFDHDRRADDRRTGLIEHTSGDAGGLRPQQRRREHGCHK